ncbi:hypothetical protein B0T22DRAFT_479122 [Podospora appendiculata]|uniref:Carbohydrate-binding module family 18 protein n=1 Tax=Podospora appendiculata TaxID=314037 RepID=A0AAE1CBV4_9PEZI|nr:hypothetical protein B0T22DRAFT_479122 [Podospora appendiculata]
MGPFRLAKSAFACFLGIATLVAADANAPCTKTVQAQPGDTCATIASAAGITVAQFLISNPSVTSCSQLQVGATYCLAGVAATTASPTTPSTSTAAPPASSSTGPLKVSTDGTCGSGVTCGGSTFGSCCSEHGYCGSTADYCTTGCQAGFGSCGSGAVSSSSSSSSSAVVTAPITTTSPVSGPSTTVTATVTTTATIGVTRTSIVLTTSTNVVPATTTQTVSSTVLLTNTVTQTATVAAITSTILATSTITLTAVTTQTIKSTALATSIVTLTTTSLVLATSTATSTKTASTTITNTAQVTSVVLETLTTIKTLTITSVNTVGCATGPSFVTTVKPTTTSTSIGRPSLVTSTTAPTPAYPSPILPGTIDSCVSYDQIQSTDTCRTIANRNDISLRNFYKYNPTVSLTAGLLPTLCTPGLLDLLLSGLCQIDCENLWPGYFVCVGV